MSPCYLPRKAAACPAHVRRQVEVLCREEHTWQLFISAFAVTTPVVASSPLITRCMNSYANTRRYPLAHFVGDCLFIEHHDAKPRQRCGWLNEYRGNSNNRDKNRWHPNDELRGWSPCWWSGHGARRFKSRAGWRHGLGWGNLNGWQRPGEQWRDAFDRRNQRRR